LVIGTLGTTTRSGISVQGISSANTTRSGINVQGISSANVPIIKVEYNVEEHLYV
jgi:hypothetical protein